MFKLSDNYSLRLTGCTKYFPGETYAWGPGIHRDFVIHYIVSGRGYYVTDGKKYSVKTGESFIILPGKTVHYYPDSKEPWVYIWVNFTGAEAKNLLAMTAFFESPVAPASAELAALYGAFSDEVHTKHVRLKNAGLLQVLLSEYIRLYPASQGQSVTDYLYFAKQYIAANSYRQNFGVAELAQAVGLERSYLYRLFMEGEGMSPMKYIINTRLENARQMLSDGAQQIKLVAYSSGYDNPLYFSNCFKKKYGMSPREYLKSIKKN